MLKPLGFIYITKFGVILYYFKGEIWELSSCQCTFVLALHLHGVPAWLRLVSPSAVCPAQPLLQQGIDQSRLLRAVSTWVFIISKHGDSTVSLGTLLLHHTHSVKVVLCVWIEFSVFQFASIISGGHGVTGCPWVEWGSYSFTLLYNI